MPRAPMLACVTGTVNQALLPGNENRIPKAEIKGRLLLSADEKPNWPRSLTGWGEAAFTAETDTILGWYRVANAEDLGVISCPNV